MGTRITRGALFTLITLLVGCDHATKIAARNDLAAGRVVTLLRGVLDLRYAENADTAFSLTRGWTSTAKPVVLTLLALGMTLTLVAIGRRYGRSAAPRQRLAFALLVAGAIGNGLDRLVRGYVVDFIHLTHWPVFNVADVLIVAGMGLLALPARRPHAGPTAASSA